MFEIGNSLREARLRQQIDFPELEQGTKVRAKYLRALEEEKFDVLPAPTYIKGFLRTYADALGLDGQLYVDEYNSRFVPGEEEFPVRPRRSSTPPVNRRAVTRGVLLVLVAIAVLFALVIAAWKYGSADKPRYAGVNAPHPSTPATKPSAAKALRQAHPVRATAQLVLTATKGDCWLQVFNGSPTGKLRYEGTLRMGETPLALSAPRLYLRTGAPGNLRAVVNGKAVHIPGGGQPVQLLVTPNGITPAPKTA
jgi:cytoskeleton protein RodZ